MIFQRIPRVSVERFLPSDLAGLAEWLDADTISGSDGDAVATWTARTGTNAVQATADYKPLLKKGANGINGHNVLLPDGSNDYMGIALNLSSYTEMTWFAAFQNSTDSGTILDTINGAGVWWIGRKQAMFYYDEPGQGGTWSYDTDAHVYSGSFKNSNTYNHFIDGADAGNGAFGTADWWSTSSLVLFCNRDLNGSWYGGKLAELLIYNVQLSTTNRQKVENYLMSKYGI